MFSFRMLSTSNIHKKQRTQMRVSRPTNSQVGVPTEGAPLLLDMATSSTAYFALVEAQRAGRCVGDDIGFDAAGDVTTDPGAILAGGAMRSFDRCPPTDKQGWGPGPKLALRCAAEERAVGVHVGDPITMAYRSYKGSHLALLVELLAGPLVGGAIADKVGIQSLSSMYLCCSALQCLLQDVPLCNARCHRCLYSLIHTGRKRQLGQPCDCD